MSDITFICTYHRITKSNTLEDYTKLIRSRTSNLTEECVLQVQSAFIIYHLYQNHIPKTLIWSIWCFFSILEQFQIGAASEKLGMCSQHHKELRKIISELYNNCNCFGNLSPNPPCVSTLGSLRLLQ
jgi:hypothetical protein